MTLIRLDKTFRALLVLTLGMLLFPQRPAGQQARDLRVVLVKSDSLWKEYVQTSRVIASALRAGGQSLRIEEAFLETEPERASLFWNSISADRPDLIVSVGTPATRAAIRHAGGIPLVFTLVLDNPRSTVDNSARQNIAGVTLMIPPGEQLDAVRRAIPGARRVGLLYSRVNAALYRPAVAEAESLGLRLIVREVNGEAEVPQSLRSLLTEVDVLWMPPDNVIYDNRTLRFILLECFQNSVPIVAASREVAEAGTPLSLGVDYEDIGLQTAELALRRLRGQASRQTPVESPRRVVLYLNDYVASSLGLELPPTVRENAVPVRNGGR